MTHPRVQRSFRRGLPSYHRAATIQADIATHLATTLACKAPRKLGTLLEFGCGTGHLTHALRAQISFDTLHLNDLVPDCGLLAPNDCQFHPGPIETLPLPANLALIASASTVQWVVDLPALMTRLWAHLAPGGWLALSGFAPDHFHQLQAVGSRASAPSYVSMQDWAAMLPTEAKVHHLSQETKTMHFATAIDLLRHLRDTGVNGQAQGGWSRTRLAVFEAEYRLRFGQDEQLPLTYAPIYLIAQKPA